MNFIESNVERCKGRESVSEVFKGERTWAC